MQSLKARIDDGSGSLCAADQNLIGRKFNAAPVYADPARCVALRVDIDKQRLFPETPSAAAKLTDVVVFPTPPFWLATAIIFANGIPLSF